MQVFAFFFFAVATFGSSDVNKFNFRFHQWDSLNTARVRCMLTNQLFGSTGIMLGIISFVNGRSDLVKLLADDTFLKVHSEGHRWENIKFKRHTVARKRI
jgi:hypothetical protein